MPIVIPGTSNFSQATVTHKWANADGTVASGTVNFQLTQRMTNGGLSIAPASEITVQLDDTGSISQQLVSNEDTGTTPTGTQWTVYIRVAGASVESYSITIPSGGPTVDLGTLLPEAQQVQ